MIAPPACRPGPRRRAVFGPPGPGPADRAPFLRCRNASNTSRCARPVGSEGQHGDGHSSSPTPGPARSGRSAPAGGRRPKPFRPGTALPPCLDSPGPPRLTRPSSAACRKESLVEPAWAHSIRAGRIESSCHDAASRAAAGANGFAVRLQEPNHAGQIAIGSHLALPGRLLQGPQQADAQAVRGFAGLPRRSSSSDRSRAVPRLAISVSTPSSPSAGTLLARTRSTSGRSTSRRTDRFQGKQRAPRVAAKSQPALLQSGHPVAVAAPGRSTTGRTRESDPAAGPAPPAPPPPPGPRGPGPGPRTASSRTWGCSSWTSGSSRLQRLGQPGMPGRHDPGRRRPDARLGWRASKVVEQLRLDDVQGLVGPQSLQQLYRLGRVFQRPVATPRQPAPAAPPCRAP